MGQWLFDLRKRVAGLKYPIRCKYSIYEKMISDILYRVWLNVIPPDGVPRRYAARSGESLMHVLDRYGTPGHFPDCQGGEVEHTFAPY